MDAIKKYAKDYTAGKSSINDETYDELLKIVEIEGGVEVSEIGDMTSVGDKVQLPRKMMSMDKFSSEKDFLNWKKTGDGGEMAFFNISSKLDGISLLIFGKEAFTRGNGTYGKNVSWIKSALNIPTPPPDMMVRGELIMTKDGWKKVKEANPKMTNPLSYVAGWANSDTHNMEFVEHIKFVAFALNDSPSTYLAPTEQFEKLEDLGYESVYNESHSSLSFSQLQGILDRYREMSPYNMDGIIVSEDAPHVRDDSRNPKYAKAYKDFKSNSTYVLDVEWTISRYGLLKPVVHIEPLEIDGKTYKKVTGHNAAFIRDNMIAEGAEITIGINVVPNVQGVLTGADEEDVEEMFNTLESKGYTWNSKELIASGEAAVGQRVKVVTNFVVHLGVEGFKEKSVQKVMLKGFPTIFDILKMTEEDMVGVLGKNGHKIHPQIMEKFNSLSDASLFVSSGIFQGIGIKLANNLFDKISIVDFISGKIPRDIQDFGPERYRILEDGREEFVSWFVRLPSRTNVNRKSGTAEDISQRTMVILTGDPPKNRYKNKAAFLAAHPELYDVDKSFKKAQLLIFSKLATGTAKYKEAQEKGLKSLTYEEYDGGAR